MKIFKTTALFATALAVLGLAGCNLYDILDKPSGDEQYLSAARAYFDQGEFDKAAEMYAKLSGDFGDEVAADSAFLILDEAGASMGQFMMAFGQGEGSMGLAFTKMANAMVKNGGTPGVTKRLKILEAFQKINDIRSVPVKGMVRFTTAVAMVGEVLAEGAGPNKVVTFDDLATGGAACVPSDVPACAVEAACAKTTNFENALGDFTIPTTGTTNMDGDNPDLYMLDAAFGEINTALSEIGQGGNLGNNLNSFSNELLGVLATGLGATANCGVWALVSNDIGAQ